MAGIGIEELIWVVLAVLLGLGVVVVWIMKSEASRNFFKKEIKKLKIQLETVEHEKVMMIEEMNAMASGAGSTASGPAAGPSSAMVAKLIEKTEELEKEKARLAKELNEARASLEEVYKALCAQ